MSAPKDELATLRALYAEAVRALEGLAFFKGAAIPKSARPALLVAERKAAAVLSRPEAVAILKGESRG